MDMLEHFQDNFNLNITNKQSLANFLRVANAVHKNLLDQFGENGTFNDPANEDPYADDSGPAYSGLDLLG